MSDYRKLLTTPCWSFVIDVTGWREPENRDWPEHGWINFGLISNHDFQDFHKWRGKFRRILAVLHGETYPMLEFYRREDVDALYGCSSGSCRRRTSDQVITATDSCHRPAVK